MAQVPKFETGGKSPSNIEEYNKKKQELQDLYNKKEQETKNNQSSHPISLHNFTNHNHPDNTR